MRCGARRGREDEGDFPAAAEPERLATAHRRCYLYLSLSLSPTHARTHSYTHGSTMSYTSLTVGTRRVFSGRAFRERREGRKGGGKTRNNVVLLCILQRLNMCVWGRGIARMQTRVPLVSVCHCVRQSERTRRTQTRRRKKLVLLTSACH